MAKRCSVCAETGHDKRFHRSDVPTDVPAVGEQSLLDQLVDATPVERPADLVRAALRERRQQLTGGADREATGDAPATVTESAGDNARAWQDATIRALYGPGWPIPTPAEPTPSGLDEFLPDGEMTPEDEAELDEQRDQLAAHGLDGSVDPVQHRAFIESLPGEDAIGGRPVEDVELPDCCDVPAGIGARHDCAGAADGFDQMAEEVGIGALLDQLGEHGPQFVPWRTVRGPAEPIRLTVHGVYQLGSAEYHADPWWCGSLSNSDARRMTLPGCPAQFRYDQDAGVVVHKPHYDEGHAAHQLVLGEGPEIVVRPAEWDSWRKHAAQQWRAEQYAAGRVPLDPDQYEMVQAMAAALRAGTPFVQQLMQQPGRAEQALFWLDQASGITRRAMVDLLPESRPNGRMTLVDYKTAEAVAPDEDMSRKIYNHGYHRAAATYIDGVLALGLAEQVEMVFVFQSKTPPYLVTPVTLDVEALRIGRIQNREAIETYARCVESGYWPGFTEGVETLGVPAWIEKRYQDVAL